MPTGTPQSTTAPQPTLSPAVVDLWKRLRIHGTPGADGSQARFRRIRRGVLGMALLVIGLAVAVVVQNSLEERQERLEDARSQALGMARAVEQHVARLIDSNGQYLFDLRTHVEAEGGIDAIEPDRLDFLLHARRLYDQATRRAFLVDAEGNKRAVISDVPEKAASVAKREYFLRHLQDGDRGIAVNAPFLAEADTAWVMPISVRLDRRDGSFGGVAVLSFDVQYMLRYFSSLGLEHGASIALVGSDGKFFVRHPQFRETVGFRIGRDPPYVGTEGVLQAPSPVDGSPRLVAYRKVADYPLYAVVALSHDEILEAWMRSSLLRVAIGGAVIGVIALFTVLLLAHLDAERLACASLAQFQRAVDQAGDLLYWITEDGRVVYLNEVAARRYTPDRAHMPAHLTVRDICARQTPQSWSRFWAQLKEKGSARFDDEHVAHDGQSYPVEVAASYLEVDGAGYAFLIGREAPRPRQ